MRTGVAALVLGAVAAGSAAGGALIAGRATASPVHRAAQVQHRQTCTLSPFDHDANVVVRGIAALGACRRQSHALRLDGYRWTYRSGGELIAPDHGNGALAVVCKLRHDSLVATVYDSGSRMIGTKVCGWYESGAWRS